MVPENWTSQQVGDLCDFVNGNGFKSSEWSDNGLPIIRIQNLNGSGNFNYYLGEPKEKWLVNSGDILFAWAGTKGVSFGAKLWSGPTGVLNQHIFRVVPKENLDSRWLFIALLRVTQRVEEMAHGFKATLVHVQKSDILGQKIEVPPLPEQRKIAKILQTWDRAIATTEKLIDASKQQKKALMQQLLTGKKRFAGFEGEWEETRLEEHIHFLSGFAFKSAEFEKGTKHKLLRGINISRGFLRWTQESTFTRTDAENYLKYQLEVNDLVISMDGSLVGRNYALITPDNFEPMLLVQRVARLRCKKSLSHDYLLQHISSAYFTSFVDAVKTVTAIPHISAKDIKDFEIPLPTITEQLKISTVLSNSDKEIEKLNFKLTHLKQEKKALMQQLLTGKRRVKIDD